MAKDIRYKFDVECKCYQSAEDVPDPRELVQRKRMKWYLMICYLKHKHM